VIDKTQEGKYDATEHTASVEEKSMRAGYSRWSKGERPMFSVECQGDKRGRTTGIPLLYEFEPKTLIKDSYETFGTFGNVWNVWKQAENRNETLQEKFHDYRM